MTGPFRTLTRRCRFVVCRFVVPGLALAVGLSGAAQAQPFAQPYARAYSAHVYPAPVSSVADGGGYAEFLIHGGYIGAPLTRFPHPSELVPSAWGYGTYGIPTVAGIRRAPVGTPTVYVIEAPRGDAVRPSRQARSRLLSRERTLGSRPASVDTQTAGGARVIAVGVPGRQATLR